MNKARALDLSAIPKSIDNLSKWIQRARELILNSRMLDSDKLWYINEIAKVERVYSTMDQRHKADYVKRKRSNKRVPDKETIREACDNREYHINGCDCGLCKPNFRTVTLDYIGKAR